MACVDVSVACVDVVVDVDVDVVDVLMCRQVIYWMRRSSKTQS